METYILWPLSFVFGKVQTYFLCFSVGCWLYLSTFFIPTGAPFATYSTPINLTYTLETQPISYCLAEVKRPFVCLLLLFFRYLNYKSAPVTDVTYNNTAKFLLISFLSFCSASPINFSSFCCTSNSLNKQCLQNT